jgi:hypothetical protein
MRRLTLALATGAAALVLFGSPAYAQYQPAAAQVLGASTVAPGGTVSVTGHGCPPNTAVTTTFDDQQVGSTTSDANGDFHETITVPSNATPGQHTITSTCGSVVLSSTITVTGAGGGSTSEGSLPRTGFPVKGMVQIGLALVAAGGAALALHRSRLRNA